MSPRKSPEREESAPARSEKSAQAILRAEQELLLGDGSSRRDPFSAAFVRTMGADVIASLDDRQRKALYDALSACRPFQRHTVHLRATISLVFFRFYVVVLAGRDRRRKVAYVEHDRRLAANRLVDLASSILVGSVLFVTLAVVLYLVKSALGIDLVPGKHAWELFD